MPRNEPSEWIGKLYKVTGQFVSFTVPERNRIEHKRGVYLMLVGFEQDKVKLLTQTGAVVTSFTLERGPCHETFTYWVKRGVLTPVVVPPST